MVETLQYVNGLALVIMGYFIKREIDKNETNNQKIETLEKDMLLYKEKLTNHIDVITGSLTEMKIKISDLKNDVDHINLYVHEARHELKNLSQERVLIGSMLKDINDKLK